MILPSVRDIIRVVVVAFHVRGHMVQDNHYDHVPLSKRAPDNDTLTRNICALRVYDCEIKIVAGVVALWKGKILRVGGISAKVSGRSCRFMEQRETTQQGAAAKRKTCADVEIGPLLQL